MSSPSEVPELGRAALRTLPWRTAALAVSDLAPYAPELGSAVLVCATEHLLSREAIDRLLIGIFARSSIASSDEDPLDTNTAAPPFTMKNVAQRDSCYRGAAALRALAARDASATRCPNSHVPEVDPAAVLTRRISIGAAMVRQDILPTLPELSEIGCDPTLHATCRTWNCGHRAPESTHSARAR